jgi:hypothetical protein
MTYGPRYWGPFALNGCGPERGFRYLTPLPERPAEAHGGRPRAHPAMPSPPSERNQTGRAPGMPPVTVPSGHWQKLAQEGP